MIKVIWPYGISLKYWSASLISDFAEECLPTLEDENLWQEWGARVAGTGIFLRAGVPSPISIVQGEKKENYKEWDKWAKVVYRIMGDEYSIAGFQ